jgi:hypothetical protein
MTLAGDAEAPVRVVTYAANIKRGEEPEPGK